MVIDEKSYKFTIAFANLVAKDLPQPYMRLGVTEKTIPDFKDPLYTVRLQLNITMPALSYVYIYLNHLWGLSEGAVGLTYRKEPMIVYYSHIPLSLDEWCDPVTQAMRMVDLTYTQSMPDNLEAIVAIKDKIAFIGRHHTQIWDGEDLNTEEPNFRWKYNIQTGIVHGNLLAQRGNTTFFISSEGVINLTTEKSMVDNQIVLSSVDSINPLIYKYTKSVLNSEKNYRICRAFDYKNGPFLGFKIGNNKTLIATITPEIVSWTIFSGSFYYATSFKYYLDQLFMTIDNKILIYTDKENDETTFTDDGAGIRFNWTLPVFSADNKKYGKNSIKNHKF